MRWMFTNKNTAAEFEKLIQILVNNVQIKNADDVDGMFQNVYQLSSPTEQIVIATQATLNRYVGNRV